MTTIADALPIQQKADGAWQVEFPEGVGWFTVESEQHAKTLANVQTAKEMAWSERYDRPTLARDLEELDELLTHYGHHKAARVCKQAADDVRERLEKSDEWED